MNAYSGGFSVEELHTFLSDFKLFKSQLVKTSPGKFLLTAEEREKTALETEFILEGLIAFSEDVLNGLRLALSGSKKFFIKVVNDGEDSELKISLYRKSFGRSRLMSHLCLNAELFSNPHTKEGRDHLSRWVQDSLLELKEIKKEKATLSK